MMVHASRAAHLLAKSPDWLKAAPMRENLRTSWRQSEQKQDHCPSLLNHNAKYKRLLPPCCDFANGVWWFVIQEASIRADVSFLEVEFSRVSVSVRKPDLEIIGFLSRR